MVLTTTLPDNYDETAFAIRSSLQDVKFYIGGELRAEYSTIECKSNDLRKPYDSYLYSHRTPAETGKENPVITEVC